MTASASIVHKLLLSATYYSNGSLSDPPGSSVIVAAVAWLESTVLGTVATTIAIISVAWVGLMMLSGRLNVRYGVTVVMGSFILFGAPLIVAGIQASATGERTARFGREVPPPPIAPPPGEQFPRANRDPYAGAAVPAP